ncbi:MAG: restriction endonuclease subunit S, partial [Candidatus Marinimicrobia bacterium]|nr:restriction endonuclease subunit S [Candidatus Neomarinimicrobiota bacterium]
MNISYLIDQFNIIIETEEGFEKFRKALLQLAFQGKLTKQLPTDEPVENLLECITKEKKRLYQNGKIKKTKYLRPSELEPTLLPLPANWSLVRLGSIITFTNGYAFKSDMFTNKGIGVVKIGDLQDGKVVEKNMNYIAPQIKGDIGEKYDVLPGDLLIAMSGATTGKLAFNKSDKRYLLNQRVGILRPIELSKSVLYYFLKTKVDENLRISSGSAIPNLSTKQI